MSGTKQMLRDDVNVKVNVDVNDYFTSYIVIEQVGRQLKFLR